MKAEIIGRTIDKLAINAFFFGTGKPRVLIIGGVHGDEKEGVALSYGLMAEFAKSYPLKFGLTVIPCLNLDGFLKNTRQNSNGVDLNRNLPTNDWRADYDQKRFYPGKTANSEPENIALVDFIQQHPLIFIISLHSYKKELLNINGDCNPVDQSIHEALNIKLERDMGYPTPGCLGTFTGLERSIPTITYELLRGSNVLELRKRHLYPIVSALKLLNDQA
ncbi:MAG: hypothetical protein CBC29_00410 [Methylococcaceae bacterium TMED69]|nr:MAG: hypothetical protein CBC29_00410 [Methylococcaceae bacterium TMED69]